MSDPAEEFREISKRIFEEYLTEEDVKELAYRWAGLKARLASGSEAREPLVPYFLIIVIRSWWWGEDWGGLVGWCF